MAASIFFVTLRMLLLRGGPQDLPYEPRLTGVLVALAIVSGSIAAAIIASPGIALIGSTTTVAGLAAVVHAIMRVRKLENRYVQTLHATLCTTLAMNLLMCIPIADAAPELAKAMSATDPAQMPMTPEMAVIGMLGLWSLLVSANILRQALDTPFGLGVVIAFTVEICVWSFSMLVTSLIAAVFGIVPPAS